jgi:hypothetical protein
VRWRLITRLGPRVERDRFATAEEAIAALEEQCRAVANTSRRDTVKALTRTYDPVAQVQARAELRGPGGASGGVDVRGDGSAEAFTGRVVRRLIASRDREDAWAALRRVIAERVG